MERLQLQVVQQGADSAGVGARGWRGEEIDRLGGEVSDDGHFGVGGGRGAEGGGGGGASFRLCWKNSLCVGMTKCWSAMEMEVEVRFSVTPRQKNPACLSGAWSQPSTHTHVSSLHTMTDALETLCSLHSCTQIKKRKIIAKP